MSTGAFFNNYKQVTVRAAAALTTSYVAGATIDTQYQWNQLMLLVAYTKGSSSSAEIKIEFSNDNTTFYQQTNESISSGTTTCVVNEYTVSTGAPTNYRLAIPLRDRYVKVSAKATTSGTNTSMGVTAILGNT